MASKEKWDTYVKLVQEYLNTGTLDEDEYNFKLDIGTKYRSGAQSRDSR